MNILAKIHLPEDICSYYRACGPLAALRHIQQRIPWPEGKALGHDINVIYCDRPDWQNMAHADVFFMNRPKDSNDLAMMLMAQKLGIPVWIDYDDDVLNVPQENHHHSYFNSPEIKQAICDILTGADMITVSTPAIAKTFSSFNSKVEVIKNAWNDYLFPFKPKLDPQKVVLWRGSSTHIKDLDEVADELIEVAKWFEDWKFVFAGFNPWRITEALGAQAQIVPMMHPINFLTRIYDWKPAVQIVPLSDTPFNQAKSNCAWLEANYAGAVVVGNSALPEWGHMEYTYGTRPRDSGSFARTLSAAISDSNFTRYETWTVSRQVIMDSYLLSKVNLQRHVILEALVNRQK